MDTAATDIPQTIALENAEQRIGIMPAYGASAAFWEVRRGDVWHPVWRPWAPPQGERRFVANFPLVPFSNRVTGGGITVDGEFHPMRPNRFDPVPIHGTGWMHRWDVLSQSSTELLLAIESRRKHDYPWEYRAAERYALDGNTMIMALEVENIGDKRMPFGLAFHPFYLQGDDQQGARVQFKADGYWLAEADCIPTEHSKDIPADRNFNQLHALGREGYIDNNYTGWDGRAVIERDDIDLRIDLVTTEPQGLDTCILFRPDKQAFFCFEPITHITDAFHRPGMPGLRMLAPGESMRLEVRQTLSRLRP